MKSTTKLQVSILALSSVIVIAVFAYFSFAVSYTLDAVNNRVYINDSNVFIQAYPAALYNSGNATFEFISKWFNGNIDFAFGFDSQIINPSNARFWNGTNYIDIGKLFSKISYNYGGMNTWYVLTNYNVVAGNNYSLVSDLTMTGEGSGKYWVCVKPSAETISQAQTNGHLYCLDPFWVSSSNATSPASPATYNPLANYSFAINWTNITNGNVSFQLGRPSGTSTNYTQDYAGASLPVDNSLVLHMKLDTVNSTNYTLDSSQYKNDGKMYKFEPAPINNFTSAVFSNGTQFDGVNDYVNITGMSNMGTTIILWKKNSTDAGWFHLVNSSGTLYVNGAVGSGQIIPVTNSSGNVIIGKDSSGSYFNGTIDEVRIYNRSLSADEILAQYNAGVGRYIQNFTQAAIGGAGTYNYTWFATNSSGAQNSTQTIGYTINKSVPILTMGNGTNSLNTSGMVLYMPFSEGSGQSKTEDKSGWGNNGTLTNMNTTGNATSGWTSGKYGSGLQFDGANDYVDAGNAASLNITGALTIEAWVNPLPSAWTKKKSITIAGSASALTDYQVNLTILYDSDMRSDFGDLRFVDANGNILSYWIENYTVSTNATVWVKVPSIPTSGTTIYMYYGNPSASSASNGTNTFEFFDDFSGSSGTTPTGWTKSTQGSANTYLDGSGWLVQEVTGNTGIPTCGGNPFDWAQITKSELTLPRNYFISYRINVGPSENADKAQLHIFNSSDTGLYTTWIQRSGWSPPGKIRDSYGNSGLTYWDQTLIHKIIFFNDGPTVTHITPSETWSFALTTLTDGSDMKVRLRIDDGCAQGTGSNEIDYI